MIREKKGVRPSVDVKNPDVQLNIFIQNKRATLSLDTSGSPLYKRGWKEASGEAGLPETLAAAILMRARLFRERNSLRSFLRRGHFSHRGCLYGHANTCGIISEKNGDLSICLLLIASEWEEFKNHWDQKRRPMESQKIIGSDNDAQAVRLCREHLRKTGFEKEVLLLNSPISKLSLPRSPTLVVSDPPFGKRMHAPTQIYQEFGQFLQARCPATPWAYLLTSSFQLAQSHRLRRPLRMAPAARRTKRSLLSSNPKLRSLLLKEI